MPRLTRWMVRASLLYLLAALLTGIMLAAVRPFGLPPGLNNVAPVSVHLFMVGWVTQLIFGVVFWMFPPWSRERPHRSEALGWAVFVLLNLGLLLRAAAEPMVSAQGEAPWTWLLVVSAALQWLAALGFVVNTWGRVRER